MVNEILGKDIELNDNDIVFSLNQDFSVLSYESNLKQAIENRLKTEKGEYLNEEYGSELYKVIGQPKDKLLKERIKGYIYETLLQEPRIKLINSIEVEFVFVNNTFETSVKIVIIPIETNVPLNLIYPLFI